MPDAILPRTIFDTVTALQALLNSNGPAAEALALFDQGLVTVYISPRIRSELEDVFWRPSIRARNPQITDEQIIAGLQRFDRKAIMVSNPPPYIRYERDPDDEPIINLAIHVEADYIVSRDRDLLDLDNDPPFRRMFPFLRIVSPVAFVQAITQAQRPPIQEPEPDSEL